VTGWTAAGGGVGGALVGGACGVVVDRVVVVDDGLGLAGWADSEARHCIRAALMAANTTTIAIRR
jgi:L-serine deaminase